jgi:hypothetical protein
MKITRRFGCQTQKFEVEIDKSERAVRVHDKINRVNMDADQYSSEICEVNH